MFFFFTREILYPELTLKLGLLRVNFWKFSVLRVDFGPELVFSGLFLGKSISQVFRAFLTLKPLEAHGGGKKKFTLFLEIRRCSRFFRPSSTVHCIFPSL